MEFSPKLPASWSDAEWLTFLLLQAADADGKRDVHEMRLLRVQLGPENVERMLKVYAEFSPEERQEILQSSLPERLPSPQARQKVQQVLRRLVMADGEYSPEEQQLIKQVSNWLREGQAPNSEA